MKKHYLSVGETGAHDQNLNISERKWGKQSAGHACFSKKQKGGNMARNKTIGHQNEKLTEGFKDRYDAAQATLKDLLDKRDDPARKSY